MTGPKDWYPSQITRAGEMFGISFEDRRTLREIEKEWKEQRYTPEMSAKLRFLLDLVDRLSRWRFDEFDFPKYAALVNQPACNAYPCAFEARMPIESTTTLNAGAGIRQTLLDWAPSLGIMQAIMIVRPLVRFPKDIPEALKDDLMKSRLTMREGDPDGHGWPLIENAPLERFMVPDQVEQLRRHPFHFDRVPDTSFLAAYVSMKDQHALIEDPYGIFVTHGQRVSIVMDRDQPVSGQAEVHLSLLAARYRATGEPFMSAVNQHSGNP